MPRPLESWAAEVARRVWGDQKAVDLLMEFTRHKLRSRLVAPVIDANLERILTFSQGRPPTPARKKEVADSLIELYARSHAILMGPPDLRRQVTLGTDLSELEPVLAAALRRGKGAILAAPHFGCMHSLMAPGFRGRKLTLVVLQTVPTMFKEARLGEVTVIGVGAAALPCLRALARNELVALYADIEFFGGQRTLPFFGAPVRPPEGVARLALAAQAPIIPIYPVYEGGRDRIKADRMLEPSSGKEELERELLASMERFIARYPDHWFVLRDIWDLEASDGRNRLLLRMARYSALVDRLLGRR